MSNQNFIHSEEDLEHQVKKIKNLYANCISVSNGRPYQYEHNHFMLMEELALYFLMIEENKKCSSDATKNDE